MRAARGQAALEVVLVAPLAVALVLAIATAVAGAAAGVAVEHALGRGVAAAAGGTDPVAAARKALPRRLVAVAEVSARRGLLTVRVDPAGPAPAITGAVVLP